MIGKYTVVNIFRIYNTFNFVMSVYGDKIYYFKVDPSLSSRMSKGFVFVNDQIIVKEITKNGVIFDVFSEESNIDHPETTEVYFFYSPEIKILPEESSSIYNYLPYLCDTLPYNTNEIKEVIGQPIRVNNQFTGKYLIEGVPTPNIRYPLPSTFVCKIFQKTRINSYPTAYNPYFFIIVSSNNITLKIVFWREELRKFSSLKVGDVIKINEFKHKKKWNSMEKMDYNTFTESAYFNCEEITAKDLVKVTFEKGRAEGILFEKVAGRTEYLSVLMRYSCQSTLLEYVLMVVGGVSVVLFYNSDIKFYDIRVNKRIEIRELRKIERAGFVCYISSIYTQFELFDSGKDVLQTAGHSIFNNGDRSTTPVKVIIGNDDSNNINKITGHENNYMKDTSNEEIIKYKPYYALSDSSEVDQKNKRKKNTESISGAVGFIPDGFKSISDVSDFSFKETLFNAEITHLLFMKPHLLPIEEMIKQNLLLNECKKFVVYSAVLAVLNDGCNIEYQEDGKITEQESFGVLLENQLVCYVYNNYFDPKGKSFTKNDFLGLNSKKCYVFIDAFRADENRILYCLTGIIN